MATLTERAMLTSLSISRWSATRFDPTISDKVAKDHGAQRDMGRYTKRLVARESFAEINDIANKARSHHYRNTLPWLDDGARILPADRYFDYIRELNAHQADFDKAVRAFVGVYPDLLDEAKKKLGRLFKPEDYPSTAEIGSKFNLGIAINPLPEAQDFRVSLGDEHEARIRAEITARLDDAAQGCVRELWQRIHDHVARMVERLKAYKVNSEGKVENTFRDSLVENMRELVELLPALNVTNSAELDAMRKRLAEDLCEIDAPDLRADAKTRRAVARKAEAILKDVSDFMA